MKKLLSACLVTALMLFFAGAADQPSKWAAGDVQNAIDAGIVPEALQSAYNAPITRRDFCRLAVCLLPDAKESKNITFTDTSDTDVLRLASLGVINGKENGRFAPEDLLTRQEAAAMLYRMAGKGNIPLAKTMQLVPHVWNDRNVGTIGQAGYLAPWAREAADFCYNTGVISGVGDNCFDSNGAYTREQSMITLLRLKQWAEAGGTASKAEDRRFLFRDMQIGKYGYKNAAGEIVIPAQFDTLEGYESGYLADRLSFEGDYAVVWQDGMCCMIDKDGNRVARDNEWNGLFYGIVQVTKEKIIVTQDHESYQMLSLPDGVILSANSGYPSRTCSNGNIVYGERLEDTIAEHADVRFGLWDENFVPLTAARYRVIGDYYDGVACAQRVDGSLVLLDKAGSELDAKCGFNAAQYEIGLSWGDLLAVQKRDFSGNYLLRFDGTQVFAADGSFNVEFFSDGNFYLWAYGKGGLMDQNGRILLPENQYSTSLSGEPLRGLCIISNKVGLIDNAETYLYDTTGHQISDTDLSRGAFGDGGSTMCTSDYIHPQDAEGDLAVDRGLWAVLLDETGRELCRIENAPQTKFEDGALRVVHDDGSVNYYTPSGRKLV